MSISSRNTKLQGSTEKQPVRDEHYKTTSSSKATLKPRIPENASKANPDCFYHHGIANAPPPDMCVPENDPRDVSSTGEINSHNIDIDRKSKIYSGQKMLVGDHLAKVCELFKSQNACMSTIMEKQLSVLSLNRNETDTVLKYKAVNKFNYSDNSDISMTNNGGNYDEKIYTGVNNSIRRKFKDQTETNADEGHKELIMDIKSIEEKLISLSPLRNEVDVVYLESFIGKLKEYVGSSSVVTSTALKHDNKTAEKREEKKDAKLVALHNIKHNHLHKKKCEQLIISVWPGHTDLYWFVIKVYGIIYM